MSSLASDHSHSSALSDLNEEDEVEQSEKATRKQKTRIVPGDDRRGHNDAFGSLIGNWLGDDCSFLSDENENESASSTHVESNTAALQLDKKRITPKSLTLGEASTDSIAAAVSSSSAQTTVCYLLQDSQTQATLIEQYSQTPPKSTYLASYSIPPDKSIPQYKYTQNFGKQTLCNATQGDLRGKRAYYSGICQWIKGCKTWSGSILFERHVGGWECDIYVYFNTHERNQYQHQRQTVLIQDGQEFPIYRADAVAIVPRGADFIHFDPRFTANIDKWISEGSKLGFASKLNSSPGCAYGKNDSKNSRMVGDAARPTGGKSYSSLSKEYEVRKSGMDKLRADAGQMRSENRAEREEGGMQAIRMANEKGTKKMSILEEKELSRIEMEKSKSESINESNNVKVDSDSRMVEGTPVYIRDAQYSWIPATIESPQDDKHRVKVAVRLPSDWEECTIIPFNRSVQSIDLHRIVKLTDYPNNELPLQNIFAANDTAGKNDMADLTNLHEAAILYNLKARHKEGNPYTRVGDIMVALNPFQWIDGLYSDEKQSFYARTLIWQAPVTKVPSSDKEAKDGSQSLATAATEKQAVGYEYEKLGIHPHVYETSSLAYLGLAYEGINQAVLVTGESGAGKTETIKIVMNHLATVERSRPMWPDSDRSTASAQGSEQVVTRVLHSNPVFESFGNAKTSRNDNSSRFGKFTQLLFDLETQSEATQAGRSIPSCHLIGSKCITYLLEKSRVVNVSNGERTYHIFYQLTGAPDTAKEHIWPEGLVGAEASDFSYLSNSAESVDGMASGENWAETVASLVMFGIGGDLFLNIMRSLCVILQLGNITFESDFVDGEERAHISSADALQALSSLMGVPEEDIETSMIKRFMVTRGEEFVISLKTNEAKDGCDALAKEIYARVFDFLVNKINEYTEPSQATNTFGTISLLDIFGFESFAVNRFEQLCINYANERLQQKYVKDNFQSVKSEYEGEGINVFDFGLIDNSAVLGLLEGKLGLLNQLNEECVRPNGGDESFVYKVKVVNSDSSCLVHDKLHYPYEFAIHHYAAPIKYDARQFIERNLDKIPSDLLSSARKSTNPFISDQFDRLLMLSKEEDSKSNSAVKKRSEATKDLVTSKFQVQLSSLMSLIEKSRTRYIRCVKPNKIMMPRVLDHCHTVAQLESAGLVTAIVISRESFPNRLSYEQIIERYKFLCYKYSDMELKSGDAKIDSHTLLSSMLAGIKVNTHKGKVAPFACGKTKVYFRVGALETLESIREEYYASRAVQLQGWLRQRQERQKYITFKSGMILMQSELRRWRARTKFHASRRSAVRLQCFIRTILASLERTRLQHEHKAAIIQARWRVTKPREQFKTIRGASIQIQSLLRMDACKKAYTAKKKEIEEETAIATRMSVIQQTFDDASTVQGTVFSIDENLLEEVETMFEFLRKEIVVLRKKNATLKRQLTESEAYKREIYNHASSVDHSFALAKIRIEQMTQTNSALLEDNNRKRKDNNNLKSELALQQQSHGEQLNQMRSDFDIALANREIEVQNLQASCLSAAAMHKREVQMIRDEAERKQEQQFSEIDRLRDEIKLTQDQHQDYLAKLMDVLETTQASRRMDSQAVDLEIMLRQKDAEIVRLNKEISMQRINRGTTDYGNNQEIDNKEEAVKSMIYTVKKNRQQRKSHVQQLEALTLQLEESIASGDQSQMSSLVETLKHEIHSQEKGNSKMDREMVNMIDYSSSYFTPSTPDAESDRVNTLVAENQKLRRRLDKKHHCKKCGNHF